MDFIKKLLAKAPQIDQRTNKKLTNKGVSIFSYCFRILILLAIGYIIIYPLFYMIVTSLRDKQSYYTAATVWIPTSINPGFNYAKAIYSMRLWEGLTNTFVLEIVAAFEKASGRKVPYAIVPRRPGDVATSFADASEAKRVFGWEARLGIDEMCEDMWRFAEKHFN